MKRNGNCKCGTFCNSEPTSTKSFSRASKGDESFEEMLIENDSGDTEILLIPRHSKTDNPVHK